MNAPLPVDQSSFKRILVRNISLPLAVGVFSAGIFVAMILYLISVMNWVEHSEQVIGNATEMNRLMVEMESGMRGFVISGNDEFLSPYEISKAHMQSQTATLRSLITDNPVQQARLERIVGLQAQWDKFANEMIERRRTNQPYAEAISSGRGKNVFDEIRREFTDFVGSEERLRQERNERTKNATNWIIGIYISLSVVFGLMLAVFGRRDLMQLSDTFGEALQRHGEHAAVMQEQDWLKSGQAQLADKIIGKNTLEEIGDAVLEFLSAYVGISVGALYVREEDGSLHRAATYGVSREGRLSGMVLGAQETLVAQAARERRLLQLADLPDHYLKIATGLGQAAPKYLLLLPLLDQGSANAVIEIGFTAAPPARAVEFLRLIAPGVGGALAAAQFRQQLQRLLEETQQLNEELQTQQEELRTANEELEEQSRVLEESQVSLENQKAELEQTNEQLASQAGVLDRKNAELNEAQHALEERADELQRASRYKSEFLANMSHELRTPLNSSLILAKLLADNAKGNLSGEQVRFAETIYSAGNDLLNLINDILDISKVEAGKLELVPEAIDLAQMAEGLKAGMSAQAMQKGLQFHAVVDSDVPATIVSDSQRLEQILKNLLSNAFKFTDAGQVSLTIRRAPEGKVRFEVRDSGIGIEQEQQDAIFEAFRQADGTTSRKYGGTGLGLSISRDLAHLLGGSIAVESTPGQGSVFSLTLPEAWRADAAPAPLPMPAPAPAPARVFQAPATQSRALLAAPPAFPDDRNALPAEKSGERLVLVIEDEPAFAGILYQLAHDMHFKCLVAHGAAEGLQLAEAHRPDAILLDMRLPDSTGLSVLQQLKNNPATRHIPVHVVSATDQNDAALHLGAIGYALKPATREQLEVVFRKLEEKFTQKLKRVLLVEDDERQRDAISELIGDEDVEITAVALAAEALELLKDQVFDCMIMDLKLPDISGNELLKRMSTADICSFPPVIVYTGRNLTRDEEAELMKYSRSIIIKGARSPERLVDEVTLFLHKVEAQMPPAAQNMLRTVRGRDRLFEGRKVLLVDDDIRNIFALTSALEQKGLTVEVGRNGFEAISKLDEVKDIDLVLMDIMMPGMDGLEATRRIRQDARFAKLPIIAVTAKAMKDDQEQCLAAGATDYLAKPIDLDRLVSLMRIWMPQMERYAE